MTSDSKDSNFHSSIAAPSSNSRGKVLPISIIFFQESVHDISDGLRHCSCFNNGFDKEDFSKICLQHAL